MKERQFNSDPTPAAQGNLALDRRGIGALIVYLALSVFFFGRAVIPHLFSWQIGKGSDPSALMWFLVWWPHAFTHWLNPFLTPAVWAPIGTNIAWSTSMPLASLTAVPMTKALGPLATFNVLCLLSPALSAWAAFALCRYVTQSYWPSVLGGYIFGFSAFMLGHLWAGHLSLLMAFPIPFSVYITLLFLDRKIKAASFATLMSLTLICLFLLSLETFATMTLFGALALLMGWGACTRDARQRLWSLAVPLGLSYLITLIAIAPYLYYFLTYRLISAPIWPPARYSIDLLNFLIPTGANQLGTLGAFRHVAASFPQPTIGEAGGYLSLPLIVIAVVFARAHWHEAGARLLVELLAVACILSMGPQLQVAGRIEPIVLPWQPDWLPLMNNALPGRFSVYAFLAVALIAAMWLSRIRAGFATRLLSAGVVIVFLLPNLRPSHWTRPLRLPPFFENGLYKGYLHKKEIILPLPYTNLGDSMLWQADTGMYFRMAGGWTGPTPPEFDRWPMVRAFTHRTLLPDAGEQLAVFLQAHDVTAVVVDDRDMRTWRGPLSTLGVTPVDAGGVSLYRLALEKTQIDTGAPQRMKLRASFAQFAALAVYADKYLSNGGEATHLSPFTIEPLIPRAWMVGPAAAPEWITDPSRNWWGDLPPHLHNRLWLGSTPDGDISIGVAVKDDSVRPMIEKYGAGAAAIYYPYPERFDGRSKSGELSLLVMNFSRKRLQMLAAQITASPQWASYARPRLTQRGGIRDSSLRSE